MEQDIEHVRGASFIEEIVEEFTRLKPVGRVLRRNREQGKT